MIKAVVFDFDGLIIDTESVWFEVMSDLFKEHGHELPFGMWEKCVGTGDDELYDYLEVCLKRPIDRAALQIQGKEKHALLMKGRTIRPGVTAYLEVARKKGLRIGLASSSTREWVTGFLNKFNLYEFFDCIRTADDVKNIKPDPELYLEACKCLGVAPQEAIAFEDSPNGTRAAKAAGLLCVIVPNDITRNMAFDAFDMRLNAMSEREFIALLEEVNLSIQG
ncbi:HAD superfamily hydrolase (TIGR01509 family) [Peribacillus deserti]|uniref:HAD superfamily hydrolase (TIGR01509 family) n=1 Tax=Peribacillus deserti TaxID=673318 RepID=A0ABS2QN77_9BACI|nr:HAD family hydrolase [Peribacillus deserti]MBM7694174.1 HAD superfamily hydrolase (TIGR01509 family) [Peribacillus deserti]